ncbi:hypothetical protein AM588_10001554 [Phytophthora nicotianae]|uniref:DUF2423 domain-containing protein n=1 Tax=Phytophthora nicotianae TaxID=4792 RepID=A0A0W8CTJ9_PHYNI|nr:hypothetical protein AM588_10001554 [Phytophthora nicotianae]
MAKSLRSKIKRKFRTELRKRIGVPHQAIQEAKIQENLKKAIAAQVGGKSQEAHGRLSARSKQRDHWSGEGTDPAEAEAALLNQEADATMEDVKKAKKDKKKTKKRKSKFVHFHQLRKKGV